MQHALEIVGLCIVQYLVFVVTRVVKVTRLTVTEMKMAEMSTD